MYINKLSLKQKKKFPKKEEMALILTPMLQKLTPMLKKLILQKRMGSVIKKNATTILAIEED
jgi:hypothetical protein